MSYYAEQQVKPKTDFASSFPEEKEKEEITKDKLLESDILERLKNLENQESQILQAF